MSRHNKVNKDRYTQRGRLTPDELARERAREIYVSDTRRKFTGGTKQAQVSAPRAEAASTPDQSEREEEE
jgi:hypothetical protein